MSPWRVFVNTAKDEEGNLVEPTDIESYDDPNMRLYILSDELAMLDVATLTGAQGPIFKIGQSPNEKLYLRIGTLVYRSRIKLLERAHVADID